MKFPGFFVAAIQSQKDLDAAISQADAAMQEWTMRAARGECAWICADCGVTCADGMPDECVHGHQACTDINKRDKAKATGSQS